MYELSRVSDAAKHWAPPFFCHLPTQVTIKDTCFLLAWPFYEASVPGIGHQSLWGAGCCWMESFLKACSAFCPQGPPPTVAPRVSPAPRAPAAPALWSHVCPLPLASKPTSCTLLAVESSRQSWHVYLKNFADSLQKAFSPLSEFQTRNAFSRTQPPSPLSPEHLLRVCGYVSGQTFA